MRILLTFATAQEFAPWRTLRGFTRVQPGPLAVFESQAGGTELRVGITGIGQLPAVRAARRLLEDGADLCISTGLAGGLRPQHGTGNVLVTRALRMEDERFQLKTSDRLRRVAAVCGARVVDLFFSTDHVVLTAREKAAYGLLADAVEMESYAVLTEAARCRVPAVAVRAVSDTCRADLPLDFNRTVGSEGHLRWPRLLGQVARRPHCIPALIRFGAESRRAAESLARFLDLYVDTLAEQVRERGLFARAATR